MKSSDLYKTLLEKSYFFNSRFNKMKLTAEQVAKVSNDVKSVKVVETDPVTFEFVTKGEVSQERQNQIADYIMQQQDSYYSFNIEQTSRGFRMVCDVGYIEMDDSMPERHDPTILQKSLTRKVMAKMRSIQNREPSKYRGAGQAKCFSDYQDFKIDFPYIDKGLIRDYSSIISDIIEYNDGEVKSVNVENETTLRFKYKDSSEDITRESSLIENINEKEKEYEGYLTNHIANVQKSLEALLAIPKDRLPDYLKDEEIIVKLRNQVANHDESKWSDEEFIPYRKHFYPDGSQEELNSEEYEAAWLHHYSNNPHHWEYWCILNPDTGKFELKPDIDEEEYKFYTVERVCDWCAMSRYFNNRVIQWYSENEDTIVQPEFIIDFLNELLQLCNEFEVDKN